MKVILLQRRSRRVLTKRPQSEMCNKHIFGRRRGSTPDLRSGAMCCNRVVNHFAYLQDSKLPFTRSLDSIRKVRWLVETLILRRVCLNLWTRSCQTIFTSSSRVVRKLEGIPSKLQGFNFPSTLNVEGRSVSIVSVRELAPLRS